MIPQSSRHEEHSLSTCTGVNWGSVFGGIRRKTNLTELESKAKLKHTSNPIKLLRCAFQRKDEDMMREEERIGISSIEPSHISFFLEWRMTSFILQYLIPAYWQYTLLFPCTLATHTSMCEALRKASYFTSGSCTDPFSGQR